jgi:hypothetical protein
MADAAQGVFAKLYVVDGTAGPLAYTSANNAEIYEFVSEDIQATRQVLDTGGIRGSRSMPKERARTGIRAVQGTITLHPSPADLDKWLPRILGADESADTFELGDTFTDFGILIDRDTDIHEYNWCKVTRADFRSQPNGFLEMTLTIIGRDETLSVAAPAPAPTLSTASNAAPYVFHDCSGNAQLPSGTSREIFDIAISIDNFMDARFVNAVTATSVCPTDRLVTISTTTPYDSDESDLFRQTDDHGPAFVKFTNGNMSLRFDFASIQGPDQTPIVGGKTEIVLRNDWVARSSAATLELVVTNDSTA